MEIGALIRDSRRALPGNVNQKMICEKVKAHYPGVRISQAMLSSIEKGRIVPGVVSLAAICDVVGIPPEKMFKAILAYIQREYEEDMRKKNDRDD